MLDKLAAVQLPASELKQYTSITNVQTKGLKHHLKEPSARKLLSLEEFAVAAVTENNEDTKRSSIAGAKRKVRLELMTGYCDEANSEDETVTKPRDYNVIGTEYTSSSEDDDFDDTQPSKPDTKNNEAVEAIIDTIEKEKSPVVKQPIVSEPQIKKLPSTQRTVCKPAVFVPVDRHEAIQAARLKLPILGEEQVIMETINDNMIVILAGETGSGKTTQVPQFLYEAGYAERKQIVVTEPRRVAAISMSKRVAYEMNLSTDIVSYLIRFEGNVTDRTKLKFVTDGVLLKEIESDFVLSRYSVVILDEAHERSVYTDILVGLLSRIVQLRRKRADPLKLIIMSATLRIEDFTKNTTLFKVPPPVISVQSRQFPVTIHFNKRTDDDYVKEAFSKAVKIHNKLPEGGILIFVTGQHEVNHLVRKLRKTFPYNRRGPNSGGHPKYIASTEASDEFDMEKAIRMSRKAKRALRVEAALPHIDLNSYKLPSDDTDADLLDTLDTDMSDDDDDTPTAIGGQPMWVLPLYSLLPSDKQQKVFEEPPPGTRLCVVTTNVAETSLTIPNIKYVIDSGRQKTRLYDKITGVSAFVVTYTSKAAANQRAGRAGRTAPGHCYRLYSSAVYTDEFADFAQPDIQKKPVEDLMLQMKCMGIDRVVNFPFPSPPDSTQLATAEHKLNLLGATTPTATNTKGERIAGVTPLGHAIAAFPVAPRFGKMLALSHQHNLLPYTVCMVAALSVQELLIEMLPSSSSGEDGDLQPAKSNRWHTKRVIWAGSGQSLLLGDPLILLRAVGAAEYAGSTGKLAEFCQSNGLRPKAIAEIRKLRVQLTNEINLSMPDVCLSVDPKMIPPSDVQAKLLRQILLSGMGDQVARRVSLDDITDSDERRRLKYAYLCSEMEEPVFMHSSSVLRKLKPEWVIYQEVYELQNGATRKMFMRGVTAIEPEWLLVYVRGMCHIRTIREEPIAPRYNAADGKIRCHVDATFGRVGWEIPGGEIEMPLSELACR